MLELKVTNQDIKLTQVTPLGSPLVSGSAGEYECQFMFDETWDGFTKTAIFDIESTDFCGSCQTNYAPIPMLIQEDKCEFPTQALKKGTKVKIGVYGIKGDITRPTVYTQPLIVRQGAMPVSPENDPTPEIYIQIINSMEDTNRAVNDIKDSLKGGATEQVLSKRSDADYDFEWVDQTGGGGSASSWDALKNKPFDELNPNELEVNGLEPNRQLGVKEIPTSKVTGLDTKLNEVDSAIADKQPKGDYATKGELPTKVSQLENDKNYVDQIALNAVEAKADNNANAIKDKADKTEIPTKTSELTNDSDFATNTDTDSKLAEKLNLTGGTMQGKIDMASFGIDNLPDAIKNGQPVTFKQLNDAIAGIGTVFNLKGSKPNFEALPKDDNKIGDVWFVEDESVGYIWIEKSGVPQWEKFGPQIDLSGYLTKEGLLQTTGSATDNTMSQDAITKELNKKQGVGDYATKTEVADATKDKATKTELNDGLKGKQDKGNYALKSDIPSRLPNPKPLTFTGASIAVYDGTKPVTVPIPTGDGVSPEDRKKWDAGAEELAVGDAPDTDNTKAHLRDGGTVDIPETADEIKAIIPAGLPPETPKTAQGVMDALAKKEGGVDSRTPIKQMVATTATLDPDTEYIWGEVASLTLDFSPVPDDGFSHDYIWEFQSGASPTTLNLPESVKWAGGAAPEIESGKTYQMMLHNGGAYYAEF